MSEEKPLSEKVFEILGVKVNYNSDVKEAVEKLKLIGAKKGAVYYDDIDSIFGRFE